MLMKDIKVGDTVAYHQYSSRYSAMKAEVLEVKAIIPAHWTESWSDSRMIEARPAGVRIRYQTYGSKTEREEVVLPKNLEPWDEWERLEKARDEEEKAKSRMHSKIRGHAVLLQQQLTRLGLNAVVSSFAQKTEINMYGEADVENLRKVITYIEDHLDEVKSALGRPFASGPLFPPQPDDEEAYV